jgi:hypothetical protein
VIERRPGDLLAGLPKGPTTIEARLDWTIVEDYKMTEIGPELASMQKAIAEKRYVVPVQTAWRYATALLTVMVISDILLAVIPGIQTEVRIAAMGVLSTALAVPTGIAITRRTPPGSEPG